MNASVWKLSVCYTGIRTGASLAELGSECTRIDFRASKSGLHPEMFRGGGEGQKQCMPMWGGRAMTYAGTLVFL